MCLSCDSALRSIPSGALCPVSCPWQGFLGCGFLPAWIHRTFPLSPHCTVTTLSRVALLRQLLLLLHGGCFLLHPEHSFPNPVPTLLILPENLRFFHGFCLTPTRCPGQLRVSEQAPGVGGRMTPPPKMATSQFLESGSLLLSVAEGNGLADGFRSADHKIGSSVMTRILKRRGGRQGWAEGDGPGQAWPAVVGFEDGGRGREPRDVGAPTPKLEKATGWILP